jgi:hypothetical protein
MKFANIFIGVPQSMYAGIAILVSFFAVVIAMLFNKESLTLSQIIGSILLLILVSAPGVLFSLFQMTCLVTGAGVRNQRWWCSLYAWVISTLLILYSLLIVVVSIMSIISRKNIEKFYDNSSNEYTTSQDAASAARRYISQISSATDQNQINALIQQASTASNTAKQLRAAEQAAAAQAAQQAAAQEAAAAQATAAAQAAAAAQQAAAQQALMDAAAAANASAQLNSNALNTTSTQPIAGNAANYANVSSVPTTTTTDTSGATVAAIDTSRSTNTSAVNSQAVDQTRSTNTNTSTNIPIISSIGTDRSTNASISASQTSVPLALSGQAAQAAQTVVAAVR